MADEMYFLTAQDRDDIAEMLRDFRSSRENVTNRPHVRKQLSQSPEKYIALVRSGGIPAMSEAGTGTGPDDPGYGDCDIYRIVMTGSSSELEPVTGLTKTVYNLSTTAIAAGTWLTISRDKFGMWLPDYGTGAGSSGTDVLADWNVEGDVAYYGSSGYTLTTLQHMGISSSWLTGTGIRGNSSFGDPSFNPTDMQWHNPVTVNAMVPGLVADYTGTIFHISGCERQLTKSLGGDSYTSAIQLAMGFNTTQSYAVCNLKALGAAFPYGTVYYQIEDDTGVIWPGGFDDGSNTGMVFHGGLYISGKPVIYSAFGGGGGVPPTVPPSKLGLVSESGYPVLISGGTLTPGEQYFQYLLNNGLLANLPGALSPYGMAFLDDTKQLSIFDGHNYWMFTPDPQTGTGTGTASGGIDSPELIASTSLTSAASVPTVLTFAVPASGGVYTINLAGTVNSAAGGSVSVGVAWTDEGGTGRTGSIVGPSASSLDSIPGPIVKQPFSLSTYPNTTVTLSTTVVGTINYTIRPAVVRIT